MMFSYSLKSFVLNVVLEPMCTLLHFCIVYLPLGFSLLELVYHNLRKAMACMSRPSFQGCFRKHPKLLSHPSGKEGKKKEAAFCHQVSRNM